MPPPTLPPTAEEDSSSAAYKKRRSMARNRFNSDGSTRNAFYANPMPEPFARRKRASAQQPLNTSETDAIDFSNMDFGSVVNMAITQEGGIDKLTDLIATKPAAINTKNSRAHSTGDLPVVAPPNALSLKSRRKNRSIADAAPSNDEESGLFMKLTSKSPTDGGGTHKKYGAVKVEAKVKKPDDRTLLKKYLSPIRDDDSFDFSVEISESDRFFDEEDEISQTRAVSPGFKTFGQIKSDKNSISDSLRYSDRSMDQSSESNRLRQSLMGTNFLAPTRNVIAKNSLSSGTLGSRGKDSPRGMENKKGAGRDQEISAFSQMVHNSAYDATPPPAKPIGRPPISPKQSGHKVDLHAARPVFVVDDNDPTFFLSVRQFFDPTEWLIADVTYAATEDGMAMPIFPEDEGFISIRILLRRFVYNPLIPEFSSLQQFVWSIIIGIVMGVYTAGWKSLIELCVDFFWVTVPTFLKRIGFFTGLDGWFPLVHYMWICPTIFGAILSYAFAAAPNKIPGQNEWITNVHSRGVQDADTFGQLFVLSTLGMASGMSLGPELPLVLTAGMAGSYLAILTKQTVLQARILNLVAASSAVGGFFGFPMAGALFVLEIPHREGLQYFEALSPAIFGSIVAVLCNRMIVGNDVTGYYKYPFLTDTLPSSIFWHAVIFGIYGTGIGIGYAKGVLKLKGWVHDIFHKHDGHHESSPIDEDENEKPPFPPSETLATVTTVSIDEENGFHQESTPLVGKASRVASVDRQGVLARLGSFTNHLLSFNISHEPYRAAVSGAIAGFLIGVTGIFLPHSMFWGEAQLQNLIDKGRTPLPIFGRGDEPTADLTAWALCLIDSEAGGFSMPCSAAITVSKIFVTGLSLGTGIIGGHFWGPLFTGCIASHFFTDFADVVGNYFGTEPFIGTYPCVAILCTMGATHVVTFRAHTAIMLILTLTITAFNPLDSTVGYVAGDYSAVFPLLVVAVYVSLMVSRDQVKFYSAQRNRGDIMALPEVLCEPGKFGSPMAFDVRADSDEDDVGTIGSDNSGQLDPLPDFVPAPVELEAPAVADTTIDEIERNFTHMSSILANKDPAHAASSPLHSSPPMLNASFGAGKETAREAFGQGLSSAGLDALLSKPIEKGPSKSELRAHRRARSAAAVVQRESMPPKPSPNPRTGHRRIRTMMSEKQGEGSSRAASVADNRLVRVNSYGLVSDFQPSLIEQARARASSLHRKLPSLTSYHSRKNSADSSFFHSRKNSADSSFFRSRKNSADVSVSSIGNGSVGATNQEALMIGDANLIPPENPIWG